MSHGNGALTQCASHDCQKRNRRPLQGLSKLHGNALHHLLPSTLGSLPRASRFQYGTRRPGDVKTSTNSESRGQDGARNSKVPPLPHRRTPSSKYRPVRLAHKGVLQVETLAAFGHAYRAPRRPDHCWHEAPDCLQRIGHTSRVEKQLHLCYQALIVSTSENARIDNAPVSYRDDNRLPR